MDTLEEVLADICRRGDTAALRSILANSPEIDLNFTTDGGLTLLMHALVGFGGKCISLYYFQNPKQAPSPIHIHTQTHSNASLRVVTVYLGI